MIIVNLEQSLCEEKPLGKSILANHPFIHASSLELFHLVVPKLMDKNNLFVILIDETKLSSEVKYEDKNNNRLFFPHIYGPINEEAIIIIAPFVVENGVWVNPIASNFDFGK
jgi:uncharacterized protein (DUF952 family)